MTLSRIVDSINAAATAAKTTHEALLRVQDCLRRGEFEKAEVARLEAISAYEAQLDALFSLYRIIASF